MQVLWEKLHGYEMDLTLTLITMTEHLCISPGVASQLPRVEDVKQSHLHNSQECTEAEMSTVWAIFWTNSR